MGSTHSATSSSMKANNCHHHNPRMKMKIALVIISSLCLFQPTKAILPTAAIDVLIPAGDGGDDISYTLLASQGNFAPMPAMSTPNENLYGNSNNLPRMTPVLPPQNDPLLCGTLPTTSRNKDRKLEQQVQNPTVFIVPRGTCSFEHKALIAQQLYNAAGIIIYGTLDSRYGYNKTVNEIVYPLEYYDYDCSMKNGGGRVNIPRDKLIGFDSGSQSSLPYNRMNDNLLSGTKDSGNLCALYSANNNFEQFCPSRKCLLTGNETITNDQQLGGGASGGSSSMMEACCAWDKHIFLYNDDAMSDPNTGRAITPITIPVFYLTMKEADILLRGMNTGSVHFIVMYSRWYPKYNISAVLVWAVGVFVAALASYLSASEIRFVRKEFEERRMSSSGSNGSNGGGQNQNNDTTVSMRGYEQIPSRGGEGEYRQAIPPEESVELTPSHAIFFLIFSSAGLLTLFFFKIYNVVKVFYAFGCSGAIMQLIISPMYYKIAKRLSFRDRVVLTTQVAEIGTVTLLEVLSILTSYGLGFFWLYLAFTVRHPETIPFFWIMQNIMGACMCILFLQTMKLNSIQVASILLIAAFFYDIFFVFVTPYLTKEGKSIMVDVATSGGPPQADPSWCEKYPDGPECQGGDPLPMLFTIPRIGDYAGGSSLLGLGDIVLPGLLLSFAARYDEAKKLIGANHSPRSPRESESPCCNGKWYYGYFVPAVIAYAVGLAMANIAVYLMKMGQPALLYLVPCCLGIIVFLGWRRGELSDLWNTPKVLIACDEILYGSSNEESDVDHNNNNGGMDSSNIASSNSSIEANESGGIS